MENEYNVNSIKQLEALDHIRQRPGMYIGDSATPLSLLLEPLDNAIDELQNNVHCDKILVSIDEKTNTLIVADNSRGIPFDHKLDLYKDPPVLICNSIFSSGKFDKGSDKSYDIAAGLNGVGLTICNALSLYMKIDIYKNNKHACYVFEKDKEPVRKQLEKYDKKGFSTVITIKPNSEYFDSLIIDKDIIRERLLIAASNFPKVQILYKINDSIEKITGSQENLIQKYLGKTVKEWHVFDLKNKSKKKEKETCHISFGWDFESSQTKMELFTTVNYVKVLGGQHINSILNTIKDIFQKYAKKYKYEFELSDCLNWFKLYVNLKVVDVHFDSQTKERLSKKTDLSVLETFEKQLDNYFKNKEDLIVDLLSRFDTYRKSIQNKKINKSNTGNRKRAISGFTKLRDCTKIGGELLIGEGESAVGGLIQCRDPKKHAILPLRGVPINCASNPLNKVLENSEVKDIITALGCGIYPHCDISKLRYDKIIIVADADEAGEFITSLLIIMFAKLVPEVIKNNKLFIGKTPLFGYVDKKTFTPLWNEKEVETARKNGYKISRFKGLGEFPPQHLKTFTLDESTRNIIAVTWPDNEAKVNKIFQLIDSPVERRKLALDQWKI